MYGSKAVRRVSGCVMNGLWLFMICYSFSVLALDQQQWRINELQIDDGLPDTTVYSIAQDQSGYMWFGTTNGVARYDGYSFKNFQHDGTDLNTISNNNAGELWMATERGLNVFDEGAALFSAVMPNDPVVSKSNYAITERQSATAVVDRPVWRQSF